MKSLYKMCAGHTLLPRSLHFELHGDQAGVVLCHGGFGDVSKREYLGRQVAVKVLRARPGRDSQDMINVGHWCTLFRCTWKLTRCDVCRGSAKRS